MQNENLILLTAVSKVKLLETIRIVLVWRYNSLSGSGNSRPLRYSVGWRYTEAMRAWQVAVLVAVAGVLGWGLVTFTGERRAVARELAELAARADTLRSENRALEERLRYLEDPRNLVKEMKSQFNYREEGEQLVIIVPAAPSSTASTTLPGDVGGR